MMIQPANAIDTMESIGAEKCGRAAKAYEIDSWPDNATVEAKAKAVVKGATDARPDAATLSLDGKECTNSRCGFEAKKGQTYRLSAKTRHDELGRTLHRRSSPMTRRPPGEGRHHRGWLSNGRD